MDTARWFLEGETLKKGFNKGKVSIFSRSNWFTLFALLFSLGGIAQVPVSRAEEGITLLGVVPVSPEHLFVLRKNSTLTLARGDRMLTVTGILRGLRDFPQVSHQLFFTVVDVSGKVIKEEWVRTGQAGEFSFSVPMKEVESQRLQITGETMNTRSGGVVFSLAVDS